jgi:hypothetical protein
MTFVVYLVVAVITVFGVLLEMGLLVEPAHKVDVAKAPVSISAPPPLAEHITPETDARASETPVIPVAPRQTTVVVSGKCDVTACAVAYTSFRASDCTYQASAGRRELCTKGVASDPATAEAVLNAHSETATATSALCNVANCTAAYHSFTPADCTYQPTEGPRRLCTR